MSAQSLTLEIVAEHLPTCISFREIKILELVTLGYSSKQIACKLHISKLTVETHRRNMIRLGFKVLTN